MAEAEARLTLAARGARVGRYGIEAAIQSVHAARAVTGRTEHRALAALYGALIALAPSLGALVARAAAVGEADGAEAGLACLDGIGQVAVRSYQPYWAARAHLLRRLGREGEAAEAYARAIGLTEDSAVREWLAGRAALTTRP